MKLPMVQHLNPFYASGKLQQIGDFSSAQLIRNSHFRELEKLGNLRTIVFFGIQHLFALRIEDSKSRNKMRVGLIPYFLSFLLNPRRTVKFSYCYVNFKLALYSFKRGKCLDKRFRSVRQSLGFESKKQLSVALVCPGIISKSLGSSIDEKDVVVRVGIRDLEHIGDQRYYGCRTDIVFLNGNRSSRLTPKEVDIYANNSTHLFHRGWTVAGERILNANRFMFESRHVDHLFPYSSPLMGVTALFNILNLGNVQIHIYGMDFYMGSNDTWFDGYRSERQKKYFQRIENRAGHDLLSSMSFTRFILEYGKGRIFLVDKNGRHIELDQEKYVKKMTEKMKQSR